MDGFKLIQKYTTNEKNYITRINNLEEAIKRLTIMTKENLRKIEHMKTEFQWDDATDTSHLVHILRLTAPQSNMYLSLMNHNIEQNIPYPFLAEHWTPVYNEPFDHPTTAEELGSLISQCKKEIIVAAAEKSTATVLALAACGPKDILQLNTKKNQPVQFGNVYWYLTPKFSFGFSPTPNINQSIIDTEDEQGDKRLSWFLDGFSGGYRAGTKKKLNDNRNWRKIILTLK
ncbi:unnamed protein product [Didymodactylos carnosus]|uniref:Uncharacterized protein n=1 Tax=Didymodactylos carnosus TaxID=1234261 RepID=A0A814RTH0_9BILA|nr:unnamed protein product [Didymodactylos carnosus]CAF1137187.1 unnamed protein product [Didymodactylos carnosus]CAF3665688.1 unnamed protein product [Didymodactylos carnosus]CAF3900883.1 unnamed protein product [Didymodactylos carnosus]